MENADLVISCRFEVKDSFKKTIFIVLSIQATSSFAAGKTIHFKDICAILYIGKGIKKHRITYVLSPNLVKILKLLNQKTYDNQPNL
jgi:hypothetical protein